MLNRLVYLMEYADSFTLSGYMNKHEVSRKTVFRDMALLRDNYGFNFVYDRRTKKYTV